jgi:hypothetical protein
VSSAVLKKSGVTDKQRITRASALLAGLPPVLPADWSLRSMQWRHISHVLEVTDGRIEGPGGAAARLGLKPSTLRTRIRMLKTTR